MICRLSRRSSTCTTRRPLDLFGFEVSTNAANAFNARLKGRFREIAIQDDHRLESDVYPVLKLVNGEIKVVDEPWATALNMRLRDDYTCHGSAKGIERFNKIIESIGGISGWRCRMSRSIATSVSSKTCTRRHGADLVDDGAWEKQKDTWPPSPLTATSSRR